MFDSLKTSLLSSLFFIFAFNLLIAEEEEIYLKAISDQIQVITKDLKTLEKAVYQKSDVNPKLNLKNTKSDSLKRIFLQNIY